MKKGASGSLWRCGSAETRFQKVADNIAFPIRSSLDRQGCAGQRKLASSAGPLRRRDRQTLDCIDASARLSLAAVAGRRWRRLARAVCAAQPVDRIRAAGNALSPGHDRAGAAGLLDRAGACLQSQLPRAAAVRRHPHDGHPQAVVAEPLLRAGCAARPGDAAAVQPAQPRQRHAPRHLQRLGKGRLDCSSPPEAATVCSPSTSRRGGF